MRTSIALLTLAIIAAPLRADELSDAFDKLKAAEAANDAPGIKQWALESSRLARAESSLPPPTVESQRAFWEERRVYLLQTDIYTEYALAVGAGRPGVTPQQAIDLTETLMSQKADSDYLNLAVTPYLSGLLAARGLEAQLRGALLILELLPDNEDALAVLAEGSMQQQQFQEAIEYAGRLVEALAGKAKPEGFTDADWERKKTSLTGRGYFVAGTAACSLEAWEECERNLSQAEPLVGGDPGMAGSLYFYLGWSNYQRFKAGGDRSLLEKALAFTRQAAAIDGPVKAQAEQNVAAMEAELRR